METKAEKTKVFVYVSEADAHVPSFFTFQVRKTIPPGAGEDRFLAGEFLGFLPCQVSSIVTSRASGKSQIAFQTIRTF